MDKIWLIFKREYLVRVRKKSFIIMTLVAPLLLAAMIVIPAYLVTVGGKAEIIQVLDETNLLAGKLKNSEGRQFVFSQGTLEENKTQFLKSKNTAFLYIPKLDLQNPEGIRLYSKSNASIGNEVALKNLLRKEIENKRLELSGIDQEVLAKIKTDFKVNTINLSEEGEKKNNSLVTSGAAYGGAFLIYMFIFIYGVQIMRGVIEEKTNRIVEVIISSVKPFQLMMGKILGIAAVGLTQFILWIVLSSVVIAGVSATLMPKLTQHQKTEVAKADLPVNKKAEDMSALAKNLGSLNYPVIIGCFIFYFLGGYLLYGALFGAIGAAVDNETDTQQFMLPITIPLIMTFVVAQTVIISNPDGKVAFWMSVIPFTSPIAMMIRIPFGVPAGELALSMGLLILGFICTTWLAARIYRVGILMYGKKVNYKELSKWLFYKA